MYAIISMKDTVRVPPKDFGGKLEESILKIVKEEYEGIVDESVGVIVAVLEVDKVGEGKVIPGDGSAYYESEYKALVYKPEPKEIVEGTITEITEFGAFVRTGPIEGLIHVSQIMNDYINYDAKGPGFIGKETNKKLGLEDQVIARIVTCSLKGNIPNSKLGLTMRQPGLGKEEWLAIDLKRKEKIKKGKENTPKVEKKEIEKKTQKNKLLKKV
ncbi:MAG: DNA-directed RNA polymerase [Candidatus Diapherotrites archaeon CG10_big_fil_rev_8_21_14_0_10_31_34]|nr:MAG: DNA-directed RNA polymerase [Candidatus Diapherotrites archaeon CG10_big_fil_rev_8_21_14_0_10_31_34]